VLPDNLNVVSYSNCLNIDLGYVVSVSICFILKLKVIGLCLIVFYNNLKMSCHILSIL